jgi:hypothetical protein
MKREEVLERNLIDAVVNQNYDVMQRILSVAFNPFNVDKKDNDTDAFMLALEFNDAKAVDIIFKSFKKNFGPHNIAEPNHYVQHLIRTDNREIFTCIKNHGFLDIFKEKFTVGNSIMAISPNALEVAINDLKLPLEDSEGTLNIFLLRILSMDAYNAISDENYANRFKNLVKFLAKENYPLLEKSIVSSMINLQKFKNNHNLSEIDYKENYSELIYSFIEVGIDPFKKIKEYDLTLHHVIKEIIDTYPEIEEMNFFDCLAFEKTKAYVEKKFLDSKLSPTQVLLNDLSQEIKDRQNKHKI